VEAHGSLGGTGSFSAVTAVSHSNISVHVLNMEVLLPFSIVKESSEQLLIIKNW